nr:pyridoxamine 5'-phosphate oxidase family protein [Candidatus Sigynarchaeota archaeon]
MESKNEEQSSSWSAGLSEEAIAFTIPTVMVKLLATIDPDGYPHITLIVSNQAVSKDFIKWGQFTVGMSKRNVAANPKQGAYYMTIFPPYRFMQAKMTLDHCSTEGADAADLNDAFLFRYNTYVRIYKVYFNKVV